MTDRTNSKYYSYVTISVDIRLDFSTTRHVTTWIRNQEVRERRTKYFVLGMKWVKIFIIKNVSVLVLYEMAG